MASHSDADRKSEMSPSGAVSRRRFLQGLGAAGVAAGAGGALIPLTRLPRPGRARAETSEDAKIAAHQWAFVIDLRRCDGCEKCVKACRKMHYLHEGQEWIKVYERQDASGQTYYRPVLCQMCQNPPCVPVCPVGATYKVGDGVVVVDQDRCIGCRMCMAACPYDVRTFNWDDPLPAQNVLGKPTPEWPIPQRKGTVGKCLTCIHNTRYGKLPACVKKCPMEALYIGDLMTDLATNDRETIRLSDLLQDNDAYRYKEELGTRPRAYYIAGHGQDSD